MEMSGMTEQESFDWKQRFEKAADPMIKFLKECSNPHAVVIVDNESAQLLHGENCYVNKHI